MIHKPRAADGLGEGPRWGSSLSASNREERGLGLITAQHWRSVPAPQCEAGVSHTEHVPFANRRRGRRTRESRARKGLDYRSGWIETHVPHPREDVFGSPERAERRQARGEARRRELRAVKAPEA